MVNDKYTRLIDYLRPLGSLAVAFSGGIDSGLLLQASHHALGHRNIVAVTIKTPYLPERDLRDAVEYCKTIDVKHLIIESETPSHLRPNPVDRCYYCKRFEFSIIIKNAWEYNISQVAAGLNADDPSDYRPGISAMNELNVLFPLQAVSLNKKEIRELAKKYEIPFWNKPANACILSRIPYGDYITDEIIDRIQKAEKILQIEGFVNPRVRTYGKSARIEVETNEIIKFTDNELSSRIFRSLKELGYVDIIIDQKGYRTGSLNEGIVRQDKKEL
jgi:pyridinium-3,5-biscarboxylic acid mononucleotide sulfurtransferase